MGRWGATGDDASSVVSTHRGEIASGRWNKRCAAAKAEPDATEREGMWPSAVRLEEEWADVLRREFASALGATKCGEARAQRGRGGQASPERASPTVTAS